jgi:hypothetical protein
MKVEVFLNVGQGEKFKFKKENKLPHKNECLQGEWNCGQNISKGEKPKQFQGPSFKPKSNFVEKEAP